MPHPPITASLLQIPLMTAILAIPRAGNTGQGSMGPALGKLTRQGRMGLALHGLSTQGAMYRRANQETGELEFLLGRHFLGIITAVRTVWSVRSFMAGCKKMCHHLLVTA